MDELKRRIRAANPLPVSRDTPLSERAERELAVLLATPREPSTEGFLPRRRATLIVGTIAAAVTIILSVGVVNVFSPRPAAAASPPLLESAPLSADIGAILGRLSAMALASPTPASSDVIAAETWSAELTPAAAAAIFVQPREVIRTRQDDLSGSVVTRAGTVRWGIVEEATPPAPGTILERFDYDVGEFPLLFPVAPPTSASALQGYLLQYVGLNEATATGDVFRSIVDLRNEWVLTGAQTAAILELLSVRDDVSLLGAVTDRLGRQGIAVATDSRLGGAFRDLLIFNPTTGLLLSAEDIYLGGVPDIELTPPTVMNYIAWKDTT